MIFNKNEINSSICFNEGLNLYSVELAWIQRKFDAVFYSFKNIQKSYLKNIDQKLIEQNFKIDNTIIGISKVFNHYVVCFISLDNLESNYYFIENFELFNFTIWWENYYWFVYKDTNWEILYKTNFKKNKQFGISIIKSKFLVKNTIFNTNIYEKNIFHITDSKKIEDNLLKITKNNNKNWFVDVADFFVYNDLFINNTENNYKDFYYFLDKIQKIYNNNNNNKWYIFNITEYKWKYNPLFKINLQIDKVQLNNFEINDLIKLIYWFFTESIVGYFINKGNVTEFFSETILDISDIDIQKIENNFHIPENIYKTDKNYKKIKIDLLKLRHNLFNLKKNYWVIDNFEGSNLDNINVSVSMLRLSIDKDTLNNTIWIYEKKLESFLKQISESL